MSGGRKPWHRQPNEGGKAFTAWEIYRTLGPDRSLAEVSRRYGRHVRLIERWSKKYGWVARVAEFDAWETEQRHEAERRRLEAMAVQWGQRQESLRNDEWDLAAMLVDRAKAMLKFPIVRKVTHSVAYTLDEMREALAAGQPLMKEVTELVPSKWSFSSAAQAAELASKLMRLASGLPASATAITGMEGGPVEVETRAVDGGQDPEARTLDEIRARGRELLFQRMAAARGIVLQAATDEPTGNSAPGGDGRNDGNA